MQPTDVLKQIIQNACFAVDHEILSENRPVSAVRGPSGEQQGETMAETTQRIVTTAVMYLIETDQILLPPEIGAVLNRDLPLQRDNRDGINGIRLPDGSYTRW